MAVRDHDDANVDISLDALTGLASALARVPGVERAFIYGSWAARYRGEPGPPPIDVDVLVIGTAHRDDLYDVADAVEPGLGREVQIRSVRPETWAHPPAQNPFLAHVRARPLVELDLAAHEGVVDEFVDVTGVRVLGDYVLELTFSTGEVRVLDVEPHLWGEAFRPLVEDYDLFTAVRVDPELGTIVWPNGADLAPETVHAKSSSREDFLEAALLRGRVAIDTGRRTDLDAVITALGFDRTELEAELEAE
jgi:predicted nucleotidyltransferase